MNLVERGGLRLLQFPSLEAAGVQCAVSTRPLDVKDRAQRDRFVAALGLDPERVVSPRQMHHAQVAEIGDKTPEPLQVDGLITRTPGVPLALRAADCSLIVVVDPRKRALGVAHAGWKGSARGIVVQLVDEMERVWGIDPAGCLAAIGPTISQNRYPVGEEVPASFLRHRSWASQYVKVEKKTIYFDLAGVNRHFLLESGLAPDNIETCDLCTFDNEELLHSFRRDGTGAGHHGLVAALT